MRPVRYPATRGAAPAAGDDCRSGKLMKVLYKAMVPEMAGIEAERRR
jgi:hypothetical protein